MMWNEWGDYVADNEQNDQDSHVNFDFLSALLKPKVHTQLRAFRFLSQHPFWVLVLTICEISFRRLFLFFVVNF